MENLKSGCYYRINGTKKILYWDGYQWRKPAKDKRGKYSIVLPMEDQPKIKSVELVKESDLY